MANLNSRHDYIVALKKYDIKPLMADLQSLSSGTIRDIQHYCQDCLYYEKPKAEYESLLKTVLSVIDAERNHRRKSYKTPQRQIEHERAYKKDIWDAITNSPKIDAPESLITINTTDYFTQQGENVNTDIPYCRKVLGYDADRKELVHSNSIQANSSYGSEFTIEASVGDFLYIGERNIKKPRYSLKDYVRIIDKDGTLERWTPAKVRKEILSLKA